jgi:hypothetical protein
VEKLVVDRNDTAAAPGHTRDVMREESQEPGPAMRIVLELSSENGTVSGTLATADGSRTFWGWLELMSALELAASANRRIASDGKPASHG